jgi:tetratricopeptide (TPR) repeat protein
MIGAASPSRTQGKMPTVDKVLAQADENIGQRFGDRPLIEASIRKALGQAYMELGQYDKAEGHARRAFELRRTHLGPDRVDTIAAQNTLGWVLFWQATFRGRVEEFSILPAEVLATARKVLRPEDEETLRAMHLLSYSLKYQGKFHEARALAEELLPLYERVLGPEDPTTLMVMNHLAWLCSVTGDPEKGRQLGEESLTIQLRAEPDSPTTAYMATSLYWIYSSLGQFDRALEMMRRAMDISVPVLGLGQRFTQIAVWRYSRDALIWGINFERARKDLEAVLDRSRHETGPGAKLASCVTATGLAQLLREHGRYDDARSLLEETLAVAHRLRTELPKPDPDIEKFGTLARCLLRRWPGFAPGMRAADRPPAPFTIEAPFRAVSPVADGRIGPDEYGPVIEARFDDDVNPGLFSAESKSRIKTPDDLSVEIRTAYTEGALFLAFRVHDQFVDVGAQDALAPWLNDCVAVFINGDHAANDFPPQFFHPGTPGTREGFQLIADAAGHQLTDARDFANADWRVGTSRTRDGYIIEFEIPLALIDTKDGPAYVPAAGGSELLVNFSSTDNDAPVSEQTDHAIFWVEDPNLSQYEGGEDFWPVSLRLVPKSDGNARAGSAHPAELRPKGELP